MVALDRVNATCAKAAESRSWGRAAPHVPPGDESAIPSGVAKKAAARNGRPVGLISGGYGAAELTCR